MNEKEIFKEAMALKGMNQTILAEKLGYNHQSGIGNLIQRKSMKVDALVKLMDVMGYDVIVRGREEVKAPGGNGYIPEWKIEYDQAVEANDSEIPGMKEDIDNTGLLQKKAKR